MSAPEYIDVVTGVRSPICVDCGETFSRSAAELAGRQDPALPLSARCPGCRERRRNALNTARLAAYATGPVGAAPWPAPGPDRGHDRLHGAVCAACGLAIRVPFRPTGDRPLFCRACLNMRHGQ